MRHKEYKLVVINHLYKKSLKKGVVDQELRKLVPNFHFCPDWDFALIGLSMPELDCCLCGAGRIDIDNVYLCPMRDNDEFKN